jgi:hypothetical protein
MQITWRRFSTVDTSVCTLDQMCKAASKLFGTRQQAGSSVIRPAGAAELLHVCIILRLA